LSGSRQVYANDRIFNLYGVAIQGLLHESAINTDY